MALVPDPIFAKAVATSWAVIAPPAVNVSPLTVTDSFAFNALNVMVALELAVEPELKTLVGAEKLPEFNFKENAVPPLIFESRALNPPS